MERININKHIGLKVITYPDSQQNIILDDNILSQNVVNVTCSIRSIQDLFLLQLTFNALEHNDIECNELFIPYLLGARSDRHMIKGDSCALKVIASSISRLHTNELILCDAHSLESVKLCGASKNLIVTDLMGFDFNTSEYVLIVPDKGSLHRAEKLMSKYKFSDYVICDKSRDLKTGRITLKVTEPEKCNGKKCIIVDDICDGGGTFISIAEQIKPKRLMLVVTHGIFSKGFDELEKYFDKIVTTNTYKDNYDNKIVKCIGVW